MKNIDIREQPRLGVIWTLGMTLNGMRHRLARSLVTLAVVTVAIAFLMNTVSESLVKQSVAASTADRIANYRVAVAWSARLTRTSPIDRILVQLADTEPDGPAYREAQTFGGLDDAEMRSFHEDATTATTFFTWIDSLDYGQRRRLLHRAEGAAAFDQMQGQPERDRFASELAAMKSLRLPVESDRFAAFLERWPSSRQKAIAVRDGWERAISQVEGRLAGRSVSEALCDVEGEFGSVLREAGYGLDRDPPAVIAAEAKRLNQSNLVEQTLSSHAMRQAVAGYVDLLPGRISVSRLWDFLHDRRRAAWYVKKLDERGMAIPGLDADTIFALARAKAEEIALARAERLSAASGDGVMSERMAWLVVVSMIVCAVGIANAMLMSVTQRFREIATLKCLGALDEFIATTFIVEACVLGVIGGFVGALAGLAIGLARMLSVFKGVLVAAIPYGDLAVAVGASVLLGVVLAGVATVLSALKAARLAPMEAMRIE